jgi:hypothetical protein
MEGAVGVVLILVTCVQRSGQRILLPAANVVHCTTNDLSHVELCCLQATGRLRRTVRGPAFAVTRGPVIRSDLSNHFLGL